MKSFEETWLQLRDPLRRVEAERRLAVRKLRDTLIAVVVILAGTAWAYSAFPNLVTLWAIIIIVSVVASYFYASSYLRDYKRSFKNDVIRSIVKAISAELHYAADSGIRELEFRESKIFRIKPDRYRAEDCVVGRIGATRVKFSEVRAEYEKRTTNSKGQTTTEYRPIFAGLFFIADFNKHFKEDTLVYPDKAERLFGRFGNLLQKMNLREERLVKLEDAEFERNFAVYTDDEVEARYILTPSLMRRLLDLRKQRGELYVSFTGSNVYVAIPNKRDMFEPKLFSSLLKKREIAVFYDDLAMCAGIVDDLNLNTRIWTKH